MTYTHAVWDFNGTILNDVDAGILAVNRLLAERNLPLLSGKEDYYRVFRFPIRDYYVALGFDFSVESYETIAPLWVSLYLEYAKDTPLCEGVREALSCLQERGLTQTLLSASEKGMLQAQITDLGLLEYFESLWGRDDIHAHSKLDIARAWRASHPDARVFVIGDTEHDCEAAKVMEADCYLIAGGHQSKDKLLGTGYPVFDSLFELTDFLIAEKKI